MTAKDHIENIGEKAIVYKKTTALLVIQQGKLRSGGTQCGQGLPGSGSGMGFYRHNKA